MLMYFVKNRTNCNDCIKNMKNNYVSVYSSPFIKILEWIPKWQNKIDAWFSGRLFSKMARKSWIFHISHNRKLCMGQKWQKLQIQDLLNEVYPKGLIFKMTLFSPIDLDKIMPKNPK